MKTKVLTILTLSMFVATAIFAVDQRTGSHCKHHKKHNRGPTGATGPRGATGATGATGPTGPGFFPDYGSFYTLDRQHVAPGAPIYFEGTNILASAAFTISGPSGNTFNILEAGAYQINYGISAQGVTGNNITSVQFGLASNSTTIPGTVVSSIDQGTQGVVSNSVILPLNPGTLQVINAGVTGLRLAPNVTSSAIPPVPPISGYISIDLIQPF